MRYALLMLLAVVLCGSETYAGYTGRWVTVRATAYSPHDPIDSEYHGTKGARWRWITADGRTDVRTNPYGIAVPNIGGKPVLPYGTRVIIPHGHGYLDKSRPADRVFTVDDTGSAISRLHTRTGVMHIDLRYKSHASALAWARLGVGSFRIFVIDGVAPVVDESYKDDPFYNPYSSEP